MKLKNKIGVATLAVASVASVGAGAASANLAPTVGDYQYYNPVYVHDAPASGFTSLAACNADVQNVQSQVFSSGAPKTSNSGCWQVKPGNYTYRSISWDYGVYKALPASLKITAHKFVPGSYREHFSAAYTSADQCNSYRTSNANQIQAHGGTVAQMPNCGISGYAANGSYIYSYGAISYSGSYYLPTDGNSGLIGRTPYNGFILPM